MNQDSAARVERLLAMIDDLLAAIDAASAASPPALHATIAESAAVILRYRHILAEALAADDTQRALQGANLAAGINAGLSDAVWVDARPDIEGAGKRVSDYALATAALLRSDLGMDF